MPTLTDARFANGYRDFLGDGSELPARASATKLSPGRSSTRPRNKAGARQRTGVASGDTDGVSCTALRGTAAGRGGGAEILRRIACWAVCSVAMSPAMAGSDLGGKLFHALPYGGEIEPHRLELLQIGRRRGGLGRRHSIGSRLRKGCGLGC
jgi:hypothetical protein